MTQVLGYIVQVFVLWIHGVGFVSESRAHDLYIYG
jgi:hypothetical protein